MGNKVCELPLAFSFHRITVHCPHDIENVSKSVTGCYSCPSFRWFGIHPTYKKSGTGERVTDMKCYDTSAHAVSDMGIRMEYVRCTARNFEKFEGSLEYERMED